MYASLSQLENCEIFHFSCPKLSPCEILQLWSVSKHLPAYGILIHQRRWDKNWVCVLFSVYFTDASSLFNMNSIPL